MGAIYRIAGRVLFVAVAVLFLTTCALVFEALTGFTALSAAGWLSAYIFLTVFPSARPWKDRPATIEKD